MFVSILRRLQEAVRAELEYEESYRVRMLHGFIRAMGEGVVHVCMAMHACMHVVHPSQPVSLAAASRHQLHAREG